MAKFGWKRDSVRKVQKNLREYHKRRKKHFEVAFVAWADDTVAEMQRELQRVGAFDQGLLSAATTRTDPVWNGVKLKMIIFNPTEYATIIEFGRRPGKAPPLLPLVGWASRKGIVNLPRNISFSGDWAKKWAAAGAILRNIKKRGGGASKNKKPLDPVIRDLLIVRLIAKKIAEKGMKGRHPFSTSFERRMRVLKKEVAATLALLK